MPKQRSYTGKPKVEDFLSAFPTRQLPLLDPGRARSCPRHLVGGGETKSRTCAGWDPIRPADLKNPLSRIEPSVSAGPPSPNSDEEIAAEPSAAARSNYREPAAILAAASSASLPCSQGTISRMS